jgi:hypothetical protein
MHIPQNKMRRTEKLHSQTTTSSAVLFQKAIYNFRSDVKLRLITELFQTNV